MSLDRNEVEIVAHLARLKVSDDQIPATLASLNSILALVDRMQEIDTAGVEPLANPHDASARMRVDEVTQSNHRDAYQSVAPSTTDGLYLVPKVIE